MSDEDNAYFQPSTTLSVPSLLINTEKLWKINKTYVFVSIPTSLIAVIRESYFLFSALPKTGPIITGGRLRYSLGDSVDVNCTSADSKPAADLHWLINGQPVSILFYFSWLFWPECHVDEELKGLFVQSVSPFFLSKMSCKSLSKRLSLKVENVVVKELVNLHKVHFYCQMNP